MYSLWKERPNQKEQAMSDNLRRYRAIRDALTQWYPGQLSGTVARHLITLAALISEATGGEVSIDELCRAKAKGKRS